MLFIDIRFANCKYGSVLVSLINGISAFAGCFSVSMYIGPMWLFINLLIIMIFFVSVRQWSGTRVELFQRLKKWYLMSPCFALSIISWGSRVKWSNSRNGVAPLPTPRCCSYWKGGSRVTLDWGRQLYFLFQIWK